jgi:hypothetical protein
LLVTLHNQLLVIIVAFVVADLPLFSWFGVHSGKEKKDNEWDGPSMKDCPLRQKDVFLVPIAGENVIFDKDISYDFFLVSI